MDPKPRNTLPMTRAGTWWIIEGRHGHGFHRFDALNMTAEQAQEQAHRLLPTVTDEQVRAMHSLLLARGR